MGIYSAVVVACDYFDGDHDQPCDRQLDTGLDADEHGAYERAGDDARDEGWGQDDNGGDWLCPQHAEEHNAAERVDEAETAYWTAYLEVQSAAKAVGPIGAGTLVRVTQRQRLFKARLALSRAFEAWRELAPHAAEAAVHRSDPAPAATS